METIGKMLLGLGAMVVLVGGVLLVLAKAGVSSMPGDMSFGKGNWRVYFPLGTSLLISVILTIVLTVISRSR